MACVLLSFILVLASQCWHAASFPAFDPQQPRTFFPPNGGPVLEHVQAPVGGVVYDFGFYHAFGSSFRKFAGPSKTSQPLTSPIKVGISYHDIADFLHPAVVWTFFDSANAHVLASTVVLENTFNLTGHERFASPRPVVPVFASNPHAWLVGTNLQKIPATDVTSKVMARYNRWFLRYRNVATGKETVMDEPITAQSSTVPQDLSRETRYELTMQYCHATTGACSLSSPPVPFELRTGTAQVPVPDILVGRGPISLGCPAWLVPFHASLTEDSALMELVLYQVHTDGAVVRLMRRLGEPTALPFTVTLPYGQYIGVWRYVNPSIQSQVLFSTVVPYYHPPLHHRTSYPAIPYFPNNIDSWVQGPSPTSLPQPIVTEAIQNSFNQWQVQYRNTATGAITTATSNLSAPTSSVPTLADGNYYVSMVFRSSTSNTVSVQSPAFAITIGNTLPTTMSPSSDSNLQTSQQPQVDDFYGE